MSKSKEQCIHIIKKKIDKLENEKDSKALFLAIEETIIDISNSEFGLLWLFDESRNKIKTFIKNKEIELNLNASILKLVFLSKKGFFENYIVSHPKYNQKIDNPLNIKIKSMIVLPVLDKRREKVFGFISAYNSVNHIEELRRYDVRSLGLLDNCVYNVIKVLNNNNDDVVPTIIPQNEKKSDKNNHSVESPKKPNVLKKKETKRNIRKSKLDLEVEVELQKEKIKALENELLLKNQFIKKKEAEIEKYDLIVSEIELQEESSSSPSDIHTILEFLTNEVTYLSTEDHKIYLFLEIIKNSLHNKEQLNFLNYELDQSLLIEKFANDLYTREKMPLLFEKFNIYQLINDIGHLYSKTLAYKNITLNIFINPHTADFLKSDKDKIKSLIIHLINNIFYFTNEFGAIELNIKILDASEELNIEIKGLMYNEVKKMKGFFAQTEESHSLTSSDSGLGLSVSSNLINILGGKLKLFTSNNNEHSFMALIPIKKIENSEKKIFLHKKIVNVAILMSDENLYASQSLIRQLQSLGIEEEAISIFRNSKKMNNINFSHIFCFENMLFSGFKFKNISSLTVLQYSDANLKKIESHKSITNTLYVNSYYGLELQKMFFPEMDILDMNENTLITEDSFLSRFNRVVKRLKFS